MRAFGKQAEIALCSELISLGMQNITPKKGKMLREINAPTALNITFVDIDQDATHEKYYDYWRIANQIARKYRKFGIKTQDVFDIIFETMNGEAK